MTAREDMIEALFVFTGKAGLWLLLVVFWLAIAALLSGGIFAICKLIILIGS